MSSGSSILHQLIGKHRVDPQIAVQMLALVVDQVRPVVQQRPQRTGWRSRHRNLRGRRATGRSWHIRSFSSRRAMHRSAGVDCRPCRSSRTTVRRAHACAARIAEASPPVAVCSGRATRLDTTTRRPPDCLTVCPRSSQRILPAPRQAHGRLDQADQGIGLRISCPTARRWTGP